MMKEIIITHKPQKEKALVMVLPVYWDGVRFPAVSYFLGINMV